ncbi:MAG: hypothetical protein IJ471_04830 [Eubacterium sp.]|nr:hypothetical protein [Eubacterium sp.]
MTAFTISDIKQFMNRLLGSPLFDNFLLSEAMIQTGVTCQIDGSLQKSFYTEEQLEELGITDYPYAPFSLVRGNCFDLMKGKHVPVSFRFVFLLSPENMANTLEHSHSSFTANDISGMFINLNYRGGKLTCTTGISYKTFSMDKTLEQEWDVLVERFFKKSQIEMEPVT